MVWGVGLEFIVILAIEFGRTLVIIKIIGILRVMGRMLINKVAVGMHLTRILSCPPQ